MLVILPLAHDDPRSCSSTLGCLGRLVIFSTLIKALDRGWQTDDVAERDAFEFLLRTTAARWVPVPATATRPASIIPPRSARSPVTVFRRVAATPLLSVPVSAMAIKYVTSARDFGCGARVRKRRPAHHFASETGGHENQRHSIDLLSEDSV